MTGKRKHSLHLHITRRRKAKESSETGIELLEKSAARKYAKQKGEGWETKLEGIAQVSEGVRRAHHGMEGGHRRLQTVVKLQSGRNHHGSGTVRAK